ncbi:MULTISPECIES: acyl-CoA dehydrogenase family protein [Mycobacterium]|uniref:Acyl-CoA dehydrogenase n=1 Tax=Mycobacterium paraintracellulare TaxID=1138383 RepID=A0ABN6AV07_9MYCO|nr:MULTISPECIES: acyl-CoA dehydrogenase family protein [Mycobacterium]AFC54366.1 acyl-CoA dehydrogenase [Mycobacterium paraintracellulare]OSC28631.1 butyryl-CoA dehydrogenase [Mycobacterium paraintracellulare]WSE53705.1 acyl-CoA dehydrogenase family protein [Mycobacterium sp. 2-64]BBY72536.1 acyl-CoA dehydrogenase [Mycobacterium paraintracellulare]BCO89632.1 acyl-CoA dehydrogenase [Mycobacterium paraintracellulare]
MPELPSDDTGAWQLPEELVLLRDTVRRFMDAHVHPVEEKLDHDTVGLPRDQLVALQAKARELGLWALQTPAEYGGAGLSVLGQVVVAEEAAKCRMGAFFPALGAFGGNPPNIMFKASPDQFAKYAQPIIDGTMSKAYTAITESSGGSDPARAIQLKAVRDGSGDGGYVLNGSKMWISHAPQADWGIVYARTGEGRNGISAFILEKDTPGVTFSRIPVMASFAPYELHFDNVRIPADHLVGGEGQGFALASDFLVHGRIVYAAGPIGIAQSALDMACQWAKDRDVFGGRLADKQGIQWMLVESEVELRAARLLMYQAAWNADLGRNVRVDASVAKMYGTEAAYKVLDRCIQIHGALGISTELPLERWFRDLRVKRLGEGATEVQREVIARSLIR